MDNKGKIIESLNAIQDEIGAIGKEKKNQQQGFMFRGIDQVMNALHPLLAKHGVVVIPEVLETKREERQTKSGGNIIYTMHKVCYHFAATDGSQICAVVTGEGMDSADKSSSKALAVAYKYAMFQVFCIPTEEMAKADPDNYTPDDSRPTAEQIRRYIDNCESKADLADLAAMYGSFIKADPDLSQYAREAQTRIMGGGAR